MTEVFVKQDTEHICSLSTNRRLLHRTNSDLEQHLKSDQNSTASTSSITSGSPHSPSSSLVDLVSNPHETQNLVRPKAHVLTLYTSEKTNCSSVSANDCTSSSNANNFKVDTKGLNHNTSSPGSSRSSTIHSLRVEGPKAIAPVPIVVRPAPLKNNLNVSIKKDLSSIHLQKKVIEVRTQQQDEEHRRKLILRQQQQIQQREAVARIKEKQLIRERNQQDQCNFPTAPITDNIANNTYHYRNLNNISTTETAYNTMGSNSNQHSTQVKVMNQPQQGYVHDKSHLMHNHTMNNHPAELDSSNHPTPLFERLVTEEVQEIKTYIRMIESLNRRLSDMQGVQDDLETRLEKSTQDKLDMENQLEDLNRNWVRKCGDLEGERDAWAKRCDSERGRNERLSDLVNRKDKEIQRMIQRKYDSKGQGGHGHGHGHGHSNHKNGRAGTNQQGHTRSHTSVPAMMQGMSPHDLLVGRGSGDAIRTRNAISALSDFFGM